MKKLATLLFFTALSCVSYNRLLKAEITSSPPELSVNITDCCINLETEDFNQRLFLYRDSLMVSNIILGSKRASLNLTRSIKSDYTIVLKQMDTSYVVGFRIR